MRLRLKRVENYIQLHPDLYEEPPSFDEMSDEEITSIYDNLVSDIKLEYGITKDKEIEDYFNAVRKWYYAGMGDESTKELVHYRSELRSKKWKKTN